MKSIFSLSIVLLITGSVYCQKDSAINNYINKLNWNSFTVTPTYAPEVVIDSNAKKIIALKSKKVIQKLYANISDTNKTIAIHILLTQMLDNDTIRIGAMSIYNEGKFEAVRYVYNKAKWFFNIESESNCIDKSEIICIKNYWSKRLNKLNKR